MLRVRQRVASVFEDLMASLGVATSRQAATTKPIHAAPFGACVVLDNAKLARKLPAGTAGEAAIYTAHVKAAQIIREVLLRQVAIFNSSIRS